MATEHEVCSNCGAKLPALGGVLLCPFCGTENKVVAVVPKAVVPREEPTTGPQPTSGRNFGGAVIAVIALGALLGAVVCRSRLSAPTKTPIAALHTTTIREIAYTRIEGPPFVGSVERFDVLANLEWASTIGRAWWPDAVLKKLEVDPIHSDGMASLTSGDAHATYYFSSAGCVADHRKRAETTPGLANNTCNLHVGVDKDGPWVRMSIFEDHGKPALVRPPCSIAAVFARLAKNGQLPARPTYAIALEQDWTVTQGQGSAAISTGVPPLAAAFCKD